MEFNTRPKAKVLRVDFDAGTVRDVAESNRQAHAEHRDDLDAAQRALEPPDPTWKTWALAPFRALRDAWKVLRDITNV